MPTQRSTAKEYRRTPSRCALPSQPCSSKVPQHSVIFPPIVVQSLSRAAQPPHPRGSVSGVLVHMKRKRPRRNPFFFLFPLRSRGRGVWGWMARGGADEAIDAVGGLRGVVAGRRHSDRDASSAWKVGPSLYLSTAAFLTQAHPRTNSATAVTAAVTTTYYTPHTTTQLRPSLWLCRGRSLTPLPSPPKTGGLPFTLLAGLDVSSWLEKPGPGSRGVVTNKGRGA